MKVLMFGWEYPPHNSGGLGVACQGLARALVDKGIDLTFVLPKKADFGAENFKMVFASLPNIKVYAVNSFLMPYMTQESYRVGRKKQKSRVYANDLFSEVERYGLAAAKIARKVRGDVIHAHDWLSFGAGLAAKKAIKSSLVSHVHATEVDRTAGHPNEFIYKKEYEGTSGADRVISVSQFTKNTLINNYGLLDSKIDVVHNGIDAGCYQLGASIPVGFKAYKKKGYKIVLYVGRITIMKGPDYFINAANIVLKHHPKTLFVVAGSGDMEGKMMELASEYGISDKVIFAGFLRGRELSEVFEAADLFVMPSVSEPFGLTPLESLLHDTPVLISKQSGVSEVLHHALKTDFWDVEDMADKILSVITYPSMRKELSKNGHHEAMLASWDEAADKCIQIYSQL